MSFLRRTVVASAIALGLAGLAWASWSSNVYELAGRYHLHNRVDRFFERASEATSPPVNRARRQPSLPAPAPAPAQPATPPSIPTA